MMVSLAGREFTTVRPPRRTKRRLLASRYDADHQVQELITWLAPRVDKVTRGERQITYRQLRQVLKQHGFALGTIGSNNVEVVKIEAVKRGVIRRETVERQKTIGRIGYHSEGEFVSMKTIKQLRRMCGLREEDGTDTASFYEGADPVDTFINKYRIVLRRLEKT